MGLRLGAREVRDLDVGLLGPLQARNVAVAAATLDALAGGGGPVAPEDAWRAAWRHVTLPGRMEVLRREPLVVGDGAHNRASALALLDAIRAHFPGRRLVLVLAMAGDKLVRETAAPLLAAAARVHATRTDNPRSLAPEDLAEIAREHGAEAVAHPSAARALDAAIAEADASTTILAAGSLYLAGEARAHLGPAGSRRGA
jgi:dihydrofolate synthase/folylpolyglutamate synthase